MTITAQSLFAHQAQLLGEGRIGALARAYGQPLPVFLLETRAWHMMPSRAAVMETFWAKHRAVRAAGVGRLRACVTRETPGGEGRRVAEVVWFYVGDGGRRLGRTAARYYLSRAPEGLRIDMIEFRRIAFPQLHGWFAANAVQLRPGRQPPF